MILATVIAVATAAGPASYAISAPSIDHYSVGQVNEHTVKGAFGQNVLSTYSKSVNTPHSSAYVHNSKASNDILGHYGAPAYGGYAPALGYAHGYAAPALAHGYAAPALAHGYAGPALAHGYGGYGAFAHGYGAPALAHGYGALGHGYGAPALAYPGYAGIHGAAPLLKAAPLAGHPVSSVSFHGLGAHYGW